MRVLYFIPELKQEYGGVRQYAAALLKEMAGVKDMQLFVYHNSGDPVIADIIKTFPNLILITSNLIKEKPENIFLNKLTIFLNKILRRANLELKVTKQKQSFIECMIDYYKIDIIHCPYQYIPDTKKAKLITTMHDVQELHFPTFFDANTRAYRAVNYNRFIQNADKIIVSYEHIKNDIVKYFDKNPKDIEVILLKMSNLWFNKYLNNGEYKLIDEKYLFYPANGWQHKNHMNLFKAILVLKQTDGIEIKLKLTGDFESEYGHYLQDFVKKNDISHLVSFEGIVNEEKLFQLYKSSHGVVIPTLYEAGSFPLMESILMGIPVICSNVTSLPETIDNENALFDPNNVVDIKEKIKLLWEGNKQKHILKPSNSARKKLCEVNNVSKLQSIYENILQ